MENLADIISLNALKIYVRSGPKTQGQIVQIQLIGVSMIPKSQISICRATGLIDEVLTGLPEINDGNTYTLVADAKKMSREKGKVMGDDDLFGFEQEVLSEKVHKLVVIKELVSTTCVLQEECNCKCVSEVTNSNKSHLHLAKNHKIYVKDTMLFKCMLKYNSI